MAECKHLFVTRHRINASTTGIAYKYEVCTKCGEQKFLEGDLEQFNSDNGIEDKEDG